MNVVSLFIILVGLLLPPFILVNGRLCYETHSPLMDEKISPWMNVISFFLAFKVIDRRVKAAVFI
jgi:hypothetical protein